MKTILCWVAGILCACVAGILHFFFDEEDPWLLWWILSLVGVALLLYLVGYLLARQEEDPDG